MNINEIAQLAGVSRATVSRYLNDGYVSEEKKNMIAKVIEQTGYEPSQQARNLRSKVTKLIGVIIPRIQSEAVSRMVAGISEILSKEGYQFYNLIPTLTAEENIALPWKLDGRKENKELLREIVNMLGVENLKFLAVYPKEWCVLVKEICL